MKEAPFSLDFNDEEESFALKKIISKYLRYWPWFLAATLICLLLGLAYMRYAPVTYESVAKIKFIDDSQELNVATKAVSLLNGN